MKEEDVCPNCNEIIEYDVKEDYEGEIIEIIKCPNCKVELSIIPLSWEERPNFTLELKEEVKE